MCDYPFFIPQVVLFANSSLFWFKVTNEHREFRNYLFVTVHSVHSNLAKIPDCLRQWNFGLYVSGFWHIHAKTPRGIVVCEQ